MKERRKTQRYINSISKYGYKDYAPTKTILKANPNFKISFPTDEPIKEKEMKTEGRKKK